MDICSLLKWCQSISCNNKNTYHLASFGLKRENANKKCTIQIILIKNNVAGFLNIVTRDLAVQIVVCLKGLQLERLQGWTE